MAKAALLDRVRTGPVHRMRGELGRDEGARLYDAGARLARAVRSRAARARAGRACRVALPREPTLDELERKVVGAEAKLEPFVDRITLTLPMLCAADEVLFLVTGEDKADAAWAAFAGEPSRSTPGSLVRARRPDDCRARRRRCGYSSGSNVPIGAVIDTTTGKPPTLDSTPT